MLPEPLQGSYKRYKADTNAFATWLLETGFQQGYQPPGLAAALLTAKKRKRRGGSRGKATNTGPIEYNATLQELQVIAEVVATSPAPVPKSVLAIARRAIEGRKKISSWFMGQGYSVEDATHAYFITVLEQICDDLERKPMEPGCKKRQPTSEIDDTNGNCLSNRFAVLTVEEPQESEQASAVSSDAKIVNINVVEEEKEVAGLYNSQLMFKALCLLRDLRNIREFILSTWPEHRDQIIDLMRQGEHCCRDRY